MSKNLKEIIKPDFVKSNNLSSKNSPSTHSSSWEWNAKIDKSYFQDQNQGFSNDEGAIHNGAALNPSKLQSSALNESFDSRNNNFTKPVTELNRNYENHSNQINQINPTTITSNEPPLSINNRSIYPVLNDLNLLEIEKEKIREKIHAMNAKALGEKYPIIGKILSLEEQQTISSASSSSSSSNSSEISQQQSEILIPKIKNQRPISPANNNLERIIEESFENEKISKNNRKSKNLINQNLNDGSDSSSDSNLKSGGAIKKIFTKISTPTVIADKNLLVEPKMNEQSNNKVVVSSSNQKQQTATVTAGGTDMTKASENNSESKGNNISLNSFVSFIKGHKSKNYDLKHDDDTSFKNLIELGRMQYQKWSALDKDAANNHALEINQTNTITLNKILRNLEKAICEGKHQLAAKLAMDLAEMKVSLQVAKLKSKEISSPIIGQQEGNQDRQNFVVDIFIEDRISQKGPIQISINPSMTIRELKHKTRKDYSVPIELQRWIINEVLVYNENLTLYECGVKNNSANLYLYILAPSDELGTRGDNNNNNNNGIDYKFTIPITSKASLEDDFDDPKYAPTLEDDVEAVNRMVMTKTVMNDDEISWECPLCTLINKPMALSCSACLNTKPLEVEKFSISEELIGNKITKNFNSVGIGSSNKPAPASSLTEPSCNDPSKVPKNKESATSCLVEPSCNDRSKVPKNNESASSCLLEPSCNDKNNVPKNNEPTSSNLMETNYNVHSEVSKNVNSSVDGSNNQSAANSLTEPSCNDNSKINKNSNLNSTPIAKNDLNSSNKDTTNNEVLLRPIGDTNDLNKTNPNRKSTEVYNIIEEIIKPIEEKLSEIKVNPIEESQKRLVVTTNFPSPNITKNKYRGVDNFNPYIKDKNDENYMQNQSQNIAINSNFEKLVEETLGTGAAGAAEEYNHKSFLMLKSPYAKNYYLDLLKLDYSNVVRNFEPFECPICFGNIERGNGIVLRECLHSFCKECLADTIKFNEDAQVKCPYMDQEYSCSSLLQEREIRSLVTKDIYEKHLAISINYAEHHIENTFHCKTANCRGWCIYEDDVNVFLCPVCNLRNCLTCAAIHDGITCKQYQDELINCDTNEDAKRTKEMFKEMLDKGEALHCPTCQIIMMKKCGCDWLMCSMCKTEVCWITKGPRWGPTGKGDTSGGCKCGVNGIKCHPECKYCH